MVVETIVGADVRLDAVNVTAIKVFVDNTSSDIPQAESKIPQQTRSEAVM
jgi:hypothetical protein